MPRRNHFLASLSSADLGLLRPALQPAELHANQLVAEAEQPLGFVCFPLNCILSVVVVMRDGRTVESRTIGCESGYGLLHALGQKISAERVMAQVGGEACRLPLDALASAVERSPTMLRSLACHTQATMLQASHLAACNALHEVDQRLCRWLLMTRDRLASPVLPLTQEQLASMLGVQRTTVTAIAQALQQAELISYARGRITILDRQGLERRACECYAAMRQGSEMMVGAL